MNNCYPTHVGLAGVLGSRGRGRNRERSPLVGVTARNLVRTECSGRKVVSRDAWAARVTVVTHQKHCRVGEDTGGDFSTWRVCTDDDLTRSDSDEWLLYRSQILRPCIYRAVMVHGRQGRGGHAAMQLALINTPLCHKSQIWQYHTLQ